MDSRYLKYLSRFWLILGVVDVAIGLLFGSPTTVAVGVVLFLGAFVMFALRDRKLPVRPLPPVDRELELLVSFDKPWYEARR